MDRLLLVANPAASGFTGGLHRTACRLLSRRWDVEPVWPRSADHARSLTGAAVQSGCPVVVAMGGDGIVHHVAQAVAGTEAVLGVIPAGTTNVFARIVGLPRRPTAATKLLAGDHQVASTPVVSVTATDADGGATRWIALFALGVGHDAEIVRRAEAEPYRKYRFGGIHYARTSLATLWSDLRKIPPRLHLRTEGLEADTAGVMVQFHDVYSYFGRSPLRLASAGSAPMTVLAIDALRLRRVPALLRRVVTGAGMEGVPGLRIWTGVDRFEIDSDEPVLTQADGELHGRWRRLGVVLEPEALRVVVP